MRKTIFTICLVGLCNAAVADGVSPGALADPNVVPILREPAPTVILENQAGSGFCHNSQNPGPTESVGGYEVRLACDHILVGLGLLAALALLGVSASDSATATE